MSLTILFALLMPFLLVREASAQTSTQEAPIQRVSAPVAIVVSSGAFTLVTSTSVQFRGMNTVLLDNPSTNTALMVGHLAACTTPTTVTTSIKGPVEVAPGSNGGFLAIGQRLCLWMMSLSTAGGETIYVQGVAQNR